MWQQTIINPLSPRTFKIFIAGIAVLNRQEESVPENLREILDHVIIKTPAAKELEERFMFGYMATNSEVQKYE